MRKSEIKSFKTDYQDIIDNITDTGVDNTRENTTSLWNTPIVEREVDISLIISTFAAILVFILAFTLLGYIVEINSCRKKHRLPRHC